LKPLNKIYKKRWFARRDKLHWRAPHVCKAINDILEPKSLIDVGCATADLVLCWREQFGIKADGIEGTVECLDHALCQPHIQDLRTLNIPIGQYDLCTCLEVAEHIEPEFASVFVKNLTNLSDRILMSIAPPGQGGLYHVNCREIEYWIQLLQSFDYFYSPSYSESIKDNLEPHKNGNGIKAFYQNLVYFERKDNA